MLKSCRKYLVVGIASLFFLSTSAYAAPPTITVTIDIKPQSCPNPLNAKKKGVIPVAILGSDTLDVGDIDASTIQLNGVSPRPGFVVADVAQPNADSTNPAQGQDIDFCGGQCWEWDEVEDYPGDGHLDLVLHFDAQEVIATLPAAEDCYELQLTAVLLAGGGIEGMDWIKLLVRGRQ